MINLLPPTAKRAVVREYWMRVVVVWVLLLSFGMAIVAALQVPSYVLLSSQLTAYQSEYSNAQAKKNDYEAAEGEVTAINTLAQHVSAVAFESSATAIIDELDMLSGPTVALQGFDVVQEKGVVKEIMISGIADDRSSLATFSDRVAASDHFIEANVPISNLARDKDITFQIEVIPAPKTDS